MRRGKTGDGRLNNGLNKKEPEVNDLLNLSSFTSGSFIFLSSSVYSDPAFLIQVNRRSARILTD